MKNSQRANPANGSFVDRSGRAICFGLVATAILTLGFGGWAATAKLSGAVVTPGQVVVASDLKAVQHPDGGVVGDIRVRNGDRVKAGDVVLSLDDKLLRANLALVDDRLIALEAQLARLEAERDGFDDLIPPTELEDRMEEAKVNRALASQRAVMKARSHSRDGETAAQKEKIAQTEEEISGLEAQRAAKDEEIVLIDHELEGLEILLKKGLTPETRITALKRERSGLIGSSGALTSQIAVARGRISETQINLLQLEKSFQEQVMNEIADLSIEVDQLRERRASARLQLARVEVRAPADGIVHELAVHTVGGVVSPGETVMRIVPQADGLVVTASIAPQDINNVTVGQKADLVIAAFDTKTVPRLSGQVEYVSADLKTDPMTGVSYFEARVDLDKSAKDLLARRELQLLPGMPAEVYIETGERTMFEYLLDPLSKQVRSTFREV